MFECLIDNGCQIPGQLAGLSMSAGILQTRKARLDGTDVLVHVGRESHVYPLPSGVAKPGFDIIASPHFDHVAVRVTLYQGVADPRGSGASARRSSAIKLIFGGIVALGLIVFWVTRGRGSAT
jgi:hypothetical protein